MTGSTDYLDNFIPSTDFEEAVCFPLKCWKNICLSDVWVPSHLLSAAKKSSSQQVHEDVFHILQKEGSAKQIESFSFYIDSNEEEYSNEQEIFQSDSDEDLYSSESNITDYHKSSAESLGNTLVHKNIPVIEPQNFSKNDYHNLHENVMVTTKDEVLELNIAKINDLSHKSLNIICNVSDLEENNSNENVKQEQNITDSQTSLHEMLDTKPDIDIKRFSFDYKKKDNAELNNTLDKKKEQNSKRSSKKERQLKKKAAKIISLDEFVDNQVYEDDCDEFYKHIISKRNFETEGARLASKREFPSLVTDEIKFIKSDKSHMQDKSEIGFKSFVDVLSESVETKNDKNGNDKEILLDDANKNIFARIVMENIPLSVEVDDIYSIIQAYGSIKSFTLKSTGKFLIATVEMDLTDDYDIDWIVECLNGSEPFGACSATLKCYNATERCH